MRGGVAKDEPPPVRCKVVLFRDIGGAVNFTVHSFMGIRDLGGDIGKVYLYIFLAHDDRLGYCFDDSLLLFQGECIPLLLQVLGVMEYLVVIKGLNLDCINFALKFQE